jgi:hypothetical protein
VCSAAGPREVPPWVPLALLAGIVLGVGVVEVVKEAMGVGGYATPVSHAAGALLGFTVALFIELRIRGILPGLASAQAADGPPGPWQAIPEVLDEIPAAARSAGRSLGWFPPRWFPLRPASFVGGGAAVCFLSALLSERPGTPAILVVTLHGAAAGWFLHLNFRGGSGSPGRLRRQFQVLLAGVLVAYLAGEAVLRGPWREPQDEPFAYWWEWPMFPLYLGGVPALLVGAWREKAGLRPGLAWWSLRGLAAGALSVWVLGLALILFDGLRVCERMDRGCTDPRSPPPEAVARRAIAAIREGPAGSKPFRSQTLSGPTSGLWFYWRIGGPGFPLLPFTSALVYEPAFVAIPVGAGVLLSSAGGWLGRHGDVHG